MKRTFYLLTVLLSIASTLAIAQCNQYYDLSDGSEWEMETYNAKGKLTGKNAQKVTAFNKTGSGYEATIHSTSYDEKGKELMSGELEFKCSDGTMYIDMRNFISEDQMKAFQNYELTVEGDNLEIPSSLTVGETLKDGSITITASGSIPMSMTVNITDRKVEAKESITTPAGTFDCYKISSKMTIQNKIGVTMTFNFGAVEWLTEKVGMVKSESYNKNGKLVGSTVLTKRK